MERVSNSFQQRDLLDLHRRESGVALLELDIDGEPVDNLVTRSPDFTPPSHRHESDEEKDLRESTAVNRKAAEQALKVFDKYLKETTWKKEAEELKGDAKRLFQKYQNHALGRATKEEKAADKELKR